MNVGKTSLKLLVMEAQIMCVLEREDISAKGEKKIISKWKKEVGLLYVAV